MNFPRHIVSLDALKQNTSESLIISNQKNSKKLLAPKASSVIRTAAKTKIVFLKGVEVSDLQTFILGLDSFPHPAMPGATHLAESSAERKVRWANCFSSSKEKKARMRIMISVYLFKLILGRNRPIEIQSIGRTTF